ncbi:MAG: TonB family protein [Proteobacteria bacterium]|nr:TonB family protein [Pseudomonadota bacterium]
MNGQISSLVPASGHSGNFPCRRRLVAALAMSCVLHIALVVAAYLGENNREHSVVAAKNQMPARPFSASLKVAEQIKPAGPRETAVPVERTDGMGLLPFAAPTYYTTDQLSKRPQPLGSADLDAPEINPIVASGKMILKLWIDESGKVIDVDIEKTELPEVFSLSALAAFKRLRFAPGERGGVRVGSVMRIEVSYDDGRVPAAGR